MTPAEILDPPIPEWNAAQYPSGSPIPKDYHQKLFPEPRAANDPAANDPPKT